MQPWITQSPAYLERWIDEQEIDRSAVARVIEGLDIAVRDEVGRHTTGGQQPNLYIPGLSAAPWWENDRFPWTADLEAATPDIVAEFEALGGLRGRRTLSSNPTELADEGRWSAHYLYYTAKAYPRNIKACPKTVAALASIPGALGCGMTYFSVLDPHTHIAAHTGFTNAHLRCHLGLVTPEGPSIRVGDESRQWERGRTFVFDDSFEHEVWNDTGSGRAVLLFDLWHPDLSEVEVRAITYLMEVSRKLIYRSFWSKEFVSV
ncbi:aspartyl/asparaginyl beta-hydroxylase domain-containing protein [Streptomyces sp. P01-B04]|uniref:aspartyl/asparaginyl beta-hydroxylase domain-containing protein n=1 Tax=Streptomyces poriferorum TaxID=2798799 RepID=UPI001C5FF0AE|nr:aspartyl/asparaginyl beta-hydroxylase domain-containing protein [Streptomyces poriferorum]MBW5252113.1 aspartyl/asparaginyl beta-hydroxylase domain-containing protein [Streptomyces poriferorum]MBW5260279.1 aspartyl/asparaginyl beta-hydroxylase domain-containing protein [Streptomyces poriferorum]